MHSLNFVKIHYLYIDVKIPWVHRHPSLQHSPLADSRTWAGGPRSSWGAPPAPGRWSPRPHSASQTLQSGRISDRINMSWLVLVRCMCCAPFASSSIKLWCRSADINTILLRRTHSASSSHKKVTVSDYGDFYSDKRDKKSEPKQDNSALHESIKQVQCLHDMLMQC